MRSGVFAATLIVLPLLFVLPPAVDAQGVAWLEGPAQHPGGQERHFRIVFDVRLKEEAQFPGLQEVPVTHVLNIAAELAKAGYPSDGGSGELRGFDLDLDSFILVEEATGEAKRVPVQVIPGDIRQSDPFEARRPVVTLRFVIEGEFTPTNDARRFHIYFDSLQNGKKQPLQQDLGALSSSIGAGRGTLFYVPLPPNSAGPQGPDEPRVVRITSLHGPTTVWVQEYSQITKRPEAKSQQIPFSQVGETKEYMLGLSGTQAAASGLLQIRSTAPVMVEAFYRNHASSQFLPARDGGYVGKDFLHTAQSVETWAVFCPAVHLPADATQCQFTVTGSTSPISISANNLRTVNVPAGAVQLLTTAGQVAVQRTGVEFAAWPPLDSPAVSGVFMGYANRADNFVLNSLGAESRVSVRSLIPPNPLLHGNLRITGEALEDRWSRTWPSGQHGDEQHGSGGIIVQRVSGSGVSLMSGVLTDSVKHSAVVPVASADGGLTHTVFVPRDTTRTGPAGNPVGMGALLVFAPYPFTAVQAQVTSPGQTRTVAPGAPLDAGQVFEMEGAGAWKVVSDRPVFVVWRQFAVQSAFSVFAPGLTDITTVTNQGAAFWGPVLDANIVGDAIRLARAGDDVRFLVDVTNLRKDVDGKPLPDGAQMAVAAPAGWDSVRVVPSFLELPAATVGSSSKAHVEVQARVPTNVDASTGGATLFLLVSSATNPDFRIQVALRINFIIQRAVEVIADDQPLTVEKVISAGETVTYDVRVTNRGSLPDAFRIEYSPAQGSWSVQTTCLAGCAADPERTALLQVGESALYTVDVQASTSLSTSRLVTTFLAKSASDLSVADSVRMITSVGVQRSFRVEVDEPTRLVPPGTAASYDIRIYNEGDVNEEIVVEVGGSIPPGWGPPAVTVVGLGKLEDVGGSVSIPPKDSVDLRLVRSVPEDTLPGSLSVDRLRLRSTFADQAGADVVLRTAVAATGGIGLQLSPAQIATQPGEDVVFTLKVTATGNAPQTLRVTPRALAGSPWAFHGPDGDPAPWNLTVLPGETAELGLRATAPRTLAPSAGFVPVVALHVSGPGQPEQHTELQLRVASLSSVRVVGVASSTLPLGSDSPVALLLNNEGNVPLNVTARWQALPMSWSYRAGSVQLPVGAARLLDTSIRVPEGGPSAPVDALLVIESDGGGALLEAPWSFSVGAPALESRLQDARSLGGARAVYAVVVKNTGDAPAFHVQAVLTDGEQVYDQVVFAQILPTREHVANLIGPAASESLHVLLMADHRTDGDPMDLAGVFDAPSRPSPVVEPLLLMVALVVMARRSRP